MTSNGGGKGVITPNPQNIKFEFLTLPKNLKKLGRPCLYNIKIPPPLMNFAVP